MSNIVVREELGQTESVGFEIVTPGNTATGITSSLFESSGGKPVLGAFVVIEDETLNCSFHGADPTAAAGTNIGFALAAGQNLTLKDVDQVRKLKCIDRVSGANGKAKITLFYHKN